MVKNRKKRIISRLLAAVLCLVTAFSPLVGTPLWSGGLAVHAEQTTAPIPLRRTDGSGKAFMDERYGDPDLAALRLRRKAV